MTPLELFDDLLGPLNPINRLVGGVNAWLNIPHVKTLHERGISGYIARSVGVILGTGMHWIAVPIKGSSKGFEETLRLVRKYGIPTTHYLHDSKNLYFAVPKEQAIWAESVIRADASGKPYRAWVDTKR